MTAECFL